MAGTGIKNPSKQVVTGQDLTAWCDRYPWFKPSRKDTQGTQKQAWAYNLKRKADCG